MSSIRTPPRFQWFFPLVALAALALVPLAAAQQGVPNPQRISPTLRGGGAFLGTLVVGILVVIPLAFVAFVVGAAGNALAYLALMDGTVDSRWVALLLGAVVAGVAAAITLLGDLVSFVVSGAGVGAVVRDWRR